MRLAAQAESNVRTHAYGQYKPLHTKVLAYHIDHVIILGCQLISTSHDALSGCTIYCCSVWLNGGHAALPFPHLLVFTAVWYTTHF